MLGDTSMCTHSFRAVPHEGVTLNSSIAGNELKVVDNGAYRSLLYRSKDGSELLSSQISLMHPDIPTTSDTRELLASFLLAPVQNHVMVVGVRNIGLLKFLRSFSSAQFIEVIERDSSLISTADVYFDLRPDERLTIQQDDNLDYLLSRSVGTYDVIYVDQIPSEEPGIRDVAMLDSLCGKLNETGVMMTILRGNNISIARSIDQVIQVFPHVFVWDSPEGDSVVLAAVKHRQLVNPLVFRERARKLDSRVNAGFSFAGFIDPMVAGEYRVTGL
ncbi:polyamine aminopropyltransferase [Sansalvadorimonas verongulae]|uniref:hypothetical protein n=1 Tax=Sansalvadorimonas verongulae TaxID=2172824 RepID=UPI0012BBE269|nr:hypothetical protein [Sansalvadorimonas verongulae]MTI12436.1 hypothetical protein [Sansalvadorimonas verongulae]